MKYSAITFISGLLFAVGLGISGMTDPGKVTGFLNIAGNWNPALMFVMIGAIGFHSITYKLITKRKSPILAATFKIPTRKDIDSNLIVGSTMFGLGWGLLGYCPGPAVVSLVSPNSSLLIFVGAMLAGMILEKAHKNMKSNATNKTTMTQEVNPQL